MYRFLKGQFVAEVRVNCHYCLWPCAGPVSSKEMKKLKDRTPELPSESPFLPSKRKIAHGDEPVTLTGINPLHIGVADPDEEMMPIPPFLPPQGQDYDDDDDELMPLPVIKPGGIGAMDPGKSLKPVSISSLAGGTYLQSAGSVKVTDLTATWREAVQEEGEGSKGGDQLDEGKDLMDTAVLNNVSFELTQVGSTGLASPTQ